MAAMTGPAPNKGTSGIIKAAPGKNGLHYMATAVRTPGSMPHPQANMMAAVANSRIKAGAKSQKSAPPSPAKVVRQPRSTHQVNAPRNLQVKKPAAATRSGARGGSRGSTAAATSGTDWLSPQTPEALRKQAADTIGISYKPIYTDLNSQQGQAQALDAKRASDYKYYQNWLAQQGAALSEHNATANQTLTNALGAISQVQNAYVQGNPQDQAAVAQYGTGPSAADAQTNAGLLANSVAGGKATAATSQATGVTKAATDTNELHATVANDFGFADANRQKQVADLNTVLSGIAANRTKAQAAQAGDTAKEIARLEGVEISKAQSQENFQAAESKLGITKANVASEIAARQTNSGIAQQNANTSATRAQQSQMNSDRTFQLNSKRLGLATARDLYQRQHGLGPYKGKTKPQLSLSSQRSLFSAIDGTRGEFQKVTQGYNLDGSHVTPEQAYHIVANGGTYYTYQPSPTTKDPKRTAARATKATQEKTPELLNAAYNLYHQGFINSADLAALNRLGLYGVRQRYKVSSAAAKKGAGKVVSKVGSIIGGAGGASLGY